MKKSYFATHRCAESLKRHVPIRFGYEFEFLHLTREEIPKWRIYHIQWDADYLESCYLNPVAEIKYCPFCGQELEEPSVEA